MGARGRRRWLGEWVPDPTFVTRLERLGNDLLDAGAEAGQHYVRISGLIHEHHARLNQPGAIRRHIDHTDWTVGFEEPEWAAEIPRLLPRAVANFTHSIRPTWDHLERAKRPLRLTEHGWPVVTDEWAAIKDVDDFAKHDELPVLRHSWSFDENPPVVTEGGLDGPVVGRLVPVSSTRAFIPSQWRSPRYWYGRPVVIEFVFGSITRKHGGLAAVSGRSLQSFLEQSMMAHAELAKVLDSVASTLTTGETP